MTSPIELVKNELGLTSKAAQRLGHYSAFSLKRTTLHLPQLADTHCSLAKLQEYVRVNNCGGGLVIVGPTGVGKTTTTESYASLMPPVDTGEVTTTRILMINMPSAPSIKSITEGLLHKLGYTRYRSLTPERRTLILNDLIVRCGVEMILIDNFQHLENVASVREASRCVDWLKSLVDLRGLALVLIGLPEIENTLEIRSDVLRRFTARINLYPFSPDVSTEWDTFRGVLRQFEKLIPVPADVPLYEATRARKIWLATYGLIDYVVTLLDSSIEIAEEFGYDQIDDLVLAAAFRRAIWNQCPDQLNPFAAQGKLRVLHGKSEPFQQMRQHCERGPVSKFDTSFLIQ